MPGKGGIDFPDASALLDLLTGANDDGLDELFDLTKLPRKMMEIERKYCLTANNESVDIALTDFMASFSKFREEKDISIESMITFVGIDQYFIIKRKGKESVFRYRGGANRPPQLTVKFQTSQGSNLVRGEINLNIRYEEPEKVRAFMAIVCGLADKFQVFAIQQSGNIWIIKDEIMLVEIVAYKVARIKPPGKIEAYVEIEPLNSKDIPGVIRIIEKYEKALGLTGSICEGSVAELFR